MPLFLIRMDTEQRGAGSEARIQPTIPGSVEDDIRGWVAFYMPGNAIAYVGVASDNAESVDFIERTNNAADRKTPAQVMDETGLTREHLEQWAVGPDVVVL